MSFAERIHRFNHKLGIAISWAVLLLVIVQFGLVVTSSLYGQNNLLAQESLLYLNSLLFLGTAGYTLSRDDHVRVDIFYRAKGKPFQAKVNFWGTLFFLLPVVGLLFLSGTPYVISSWTVLEGSAEVGGLQAIFILKSFLLLFAISLGLQGLAMLLESRTSRL